MKRAAGFTLIELVIVIVILGILGAVAAPRFINLQGDAYEANINGLKGSIQSAATLANTRAVLDGKENASGEAGAANNVTGFDGVVFKNGYPKADTVTDSVPDKKGILGTLQDFDTDAYTVTNDGATPPAITIKPKNRSTVNCFVKYTEAANSSTPAKIEADISACS